MAPHANVNNAVLEDFSHSQVMCNAFTDCSFPYTWNPFQSSEAIRNDLINNLLHVNLSTHKLLISDQIQAKLRFTS
jgi:hypothetical protein